jgi:hypothetical protein
MTPSECGCSRIAAEAANLDLGWLLNAAFQVKAQQDKLSTATLASRLSAPRAGRYIETPALPPLAAQVIPRAPTSDQVSNGGAGRSPQLTSRRGRNPSRVVVEAVEDLDRCGYAARPTEVVISTVITPRPAADLIRPPSLPCLTRESWRPITQSRFSRTAKFKDRMSRPSISVRSESTGRLRQHTRAIVQKRTG